MENLFSVLQELYNVNISSSQRVTKGFLSENFFLSDGDRLYFLKKYRFDSRIRIEEIHEAKTYFSDRGIPVILPLTTKGSDTFFLHDGAYYALFPFVVGKEYERESLSEKATASLGEMLGHVHLAGRNAPLLIERHFTHKVGRNTEMVGRADNLLSIILRKGELDDFDRLAVESIQAKKKYLLSGEGQNINPLLKNDHLIHGDYLNHNVFFDDTDNVSFVFDFEKVTMAPRVFELLRSMVYSFFNDVKVGEALTQARVYVDAYRKVYPLSNEELAQGLHLFRTQLLSSFWVEEEHYIKGNRRVDLFLASGQVHQTFFTDYFDEITRFLTK